MAEPGQMIRSLSGRPAARNFHSFVISEIGLGVASGAFPAGTTLPGDAEMMARYDVSRTVLREAIKTLEAKGLVEARAKVGTRVLPRARWNLYDRQVLNWIFHAPQEPSFVLGLIEVREGLERQAVGLAAQRRTAEQMRMMRYWLGQAQEASGQIETQGLALFEIHRLIAEASHNPLLRAASGLVEFAQALGLRHGPPVTLGFYDALIGALERGDAEAALLAIAPILQAERQRGIV